MSDFLSISLRWAVVAVLAAATCGCPARRQGPDIPELTEETREVQRRTARTREIREVMTRDLDRFRALADELRDPPSSLFGLDFPLDLFKHVAVECLNAPGTDRPASTVPSTERDAGSRDSADATARSARMSGHGPLSCSARFVAQLDDRLRVIPPDSRTRAMELLHKIDNFHELRLRLRRRLAKLQDVVRDNRELLAARRASLRKLRARWEERRAELRPERWTELQTRFDELKNDLAALERMTSKLERAAESWPDRIDRANHSVYFAITSRWNPVE